LNGKFVQAAEVAPIGTHFRVSPSLQKHWDALHQLWVGPDEEYTCLPTSSLPIEEQEQEEEEEEEEGEEEEEEEEEEEKRVEVEAVNIPQPKPQEVDLLTLPKEQKGIGRRSSFMKRVEAMKK
jgi:hypothetical protein